MENTMARWQHIHAMLYYVVTRLSKITSEGIIGKTPYEYLLDICAWGLRIRTPTNYSQNYSLRCVSEPENDAL